MIYNRAQATLYIMVGVMAKGCMTVAFVSKTDAGKSTILKLLPRF
jgi:ABC-type multidrug transport system fused ATPase/permease subunit